MSMSECPYCESLLDGNELEKEQHVDRCARGEGGGRAKSRAFREIVL